MAKNSPLTRKRARRLRREMTEAETVLWTALRRHQVVCHYRRQVPIGPYIVDFACLTHRVIIECDGEQHDQNRHDQIRDQWLMEQGFTILRFWNNEILGRLDMVVGTIVGQCQH